MKHLFIINPVAGGRKADILGTYNAIESAMADREDDFEIYETVAPMDAAEKTKREAIRGQPLRVYACGGDGTLSECVHGAVGYSNVAVAHYPVGTGNDFIRTFGENVPLFSRFPALIDGTAVPLDVIDVNGRKCINISSVGIDARVGTDVHKYSKLRGRGAYLVSLVVNVIKGIASDMVITTENEVIEGRKSLVCVCNGQYYGGGFHPTKKARPDDGFLDVIIVDGLSRLKAAKYINAYSNAQYEQYSDIMRYITTHRLKIEAEHEFVINVDGEALHSTVADFHIVRGGVNFLFPRGFVPVTLE